MKLAAQLFTLRDYCRTPDELFETLGKIREMGYDGVEPESTLIKAADRGELKERLCQLGLSVCSVRSPFGRTGYDLNGMIDEAKAFGTGYVGIGTITGSYSFNNAGPGGFHRFAAKALEVGETLSENGLTGLYSLRSHEFVRESDGRWGFENLEEDFNGRTVQFEVDLYHLVKAGVEPKQIIKRLSGRMPVVRFRDQRIAVGEVHFFYPVRENCPVGDGVFDFADFMPALEEAGCRWITLGQEYCTRDPFECMERSLRFGRTLV